MTSSPPICSANLGLSLPLTKPNLALDAACCNMKSLTSGLMGFLLGVRVPSTSNRSSNDGEAMLFSTVGNDKNHET